MQSSYKVAAAGQLAADVADTGTFTVSYPNRPAGESNAMNSGDFTESVEHQFVVGGNKLTFPDKFSLTFGSANITVTNKSGATWKAGSNWNLSLNVAGRQIYRNERGDKPKRVARSTRGHMVVISLGAPAAKAANNICLAQAIAGAANAVIAGALAAGGVATFDVPRAMQFVSSNAGDTTQTVTVTGKDEYGNALTERVTLNGTTIVASKKAFKSVSQVAVSAVMVGNITVGTSDVLGLPVFLPGTGLVIRELQDGSTATAGTTVKGDQTAGGSTNVTGDVRGTYLPNAATDGAKSFQLVCALPDPDYLGMPQA